MAVINTDSGGYSLKVEAHIRRITRDYEVVWAHIDDVYDALSSQPFALLVVAGGDGTLHSVLNQARRATLGQSPLPLVYVPCGTLNEQAKCRRRLGGSKRLVLGRYGPNVFTYVAAAGSFTPIGYVADGRAKRRFGRLAYLGHVFSEYRVHRMAARVQVDGECYCDTYTLIMVVKSDRCFGFHFNHMYNAASLSGNILLIKAPKNKGFWGKICMFFPFFRAFFVGFRREYHSKNMVFVPFEQASVLLEEGAVDFDIDGERVSLSGKVDFAFDAYDAPFCVFNKNRDYD